MQSSEEQILGRVRQLIVVQTKLPPAEVRNDLRVWDLFPAAQGLHEDPTVTEFVRAVHGEFDVFLTEAEWESPGVGELAALIAKKVDSPESSADDRESERRAQRKGALVSFVFFTAIGVMSFFVAEGSERRRLSIALGITLFCWLILAAVHFAESRRLASQE